MKISFWKRLTAYFVLSIIVLLLMSFFADDSDAQVGATPAASTLTLDANAEPAAASRQSARETATPSALVYRRALQSPRR